MTFGLINDKYFIYKVRESRSKHVDQSLLKESDDDNFDRHLCSIFRESTGIFLAIYYFCWALEVISYFINVLVLLHTSLTYDRLLCNIIEIS